MVDWAARRGFHRTEEIRYSRLDLTAALPPAPDPAAGVTLARFDTIRPEALYAVDAEATLDEPNEVSIDAIPYDEWLTNVWSDPAVDHAVSLVVLVDGQPAAFTTMEIDPVSARAWSGGTGTRGPSAAGGLAKLAKSSVPLRRAAAAGVTAAFTSNDESNRPMLSINEWLGYRPCGSHRALLREALAGSPAPAG